MGKPKFPGLQERFEHFLLKEFNEGNAFLPGEIFSRLSGKLSENLISSEEYDDLKKNSINYIRRAIEKEILTHEGFGKRGYRIFHEQKDSQIDDNGKSATCKVNGEQSPQKNNFIESFIHLPATVILANEFAAKTASLPQKSTKAKWANPDMIMVRKNDTRRLFEEEEITKYFSLVDNSPEIIISSIELKVDLPNRSSILAALAETAINGSWANEKWLVCFQLTGAAEFDEDAINFANDNGIGIILVRLEMEQGKQSKFEVAKTLVAKTRPTLRINTEIVGKGELFPTMKRLLMAISNSDEGTFLDQDDDLLKMITLLCEARDNLVIQSYFKGSPIKDSFSTLKELNSEVFSETCHSTYRALLEAVGQTKIEKSKIDAAARSIKVQMKEEFVEILGLLQDHSKRSN